MDQPAHLTRHQRQSAPGRAWHGQPARRAPGPVLADTHLHSRLDRGRRRPSSGCQIPPGRTCASADVILHAGDVLDEGILGELSRLAPVHAVLGNNDHSLVGILPVTRLVELDGVRIGMIHDSGAAAGRARRLRRRFP